MMKLGRLRCSFCRKDETEVLKLVAGARGYICDACVAIASQIMGEPHDDNQPPSVRPSLRRQLLTRARRFLRGSAARRVGSCDVSG